MCLGCGALALSLVACSAERVPPHHAAQPTSDRTANAENAREDLASNVRVSDELRRECQLPNAPTEAPRFSTGQAALPRVGRSILDDVANCLTDGPLEGRAVLIIGRTDARGLADQNQKLSADRAEAAKNYLRERGVSRDNVRTVARGEHGAQGTDEATWALDRRVDIELVARGVSAAAEASPSPILEGTRLQSLSPANKSATEGGAEASPSSAANPRVGAAK
jgi:peptidoglycan-associated lipoprotein